MDEPLSNLDAKLRVQTRTQIAALQRRLGVTTVYVTHDQVEAMTMGDRVAVLKDGILHQCASPRELFTRPKNTFVAGFIGSPASQRSSLTSDQVTVGVRPESLHIADEGFEATIVAVEELGSDSFVYCTPLGRPDVSLVARTDGLNASQPGSIVHLMPDFTAMHVFDTASGVRLEV